MVFVMALLVPGHVLTQDVATHSATKTRQSLLLLLVRLISNPLILQHAFPEDVTPHSPPKAMVVSFRRQPMPEDILCPSL
jgi:hypothetical protein